jgi:hypothetical protein
MSEKQKLKHIADRQPKTVAEGSSLDAAAPTPDGLGEWQGGIAHRSIDGAKAKAQRTGDAKNTPGIDYPSKINETHQKKYPLYEDENGKLWRHNVATKEWDIPYEPTPA